MAYNAVPTANTGDLITAANWNTYIKDNFAAGVPDIFTAKGDIAVATAANAAAPLPIGSIGQVLSVISASEIAYRYVKPVIGYASGVGSFSTNSTSYVDITDETVSLTLNATSTVIIFYTAGWHQTNVNALNYVVGNIDGTANTIHSYFQANENAGATDEVHPVTHIYLRTGIAAGARVCKMQMKVNAGTGSIDYYHLLAIAFPE